MKQRKLNKRKGFTLVELLVVIAILAVLATVSVVGYTSFTKKAKVSNDVSLTTQMNTILQANEVTDGKNATPHEAVEELVAGGLDVTKLTPTANDYNYVWDSTQNRIFLLDEDKKVVSPTNLKASSNAVNLFAFVGKESELNTLKEYSHYLKDGYDTKTITTSTGLDVGNNKINATYKTDSDMAVTIRTNGGELTVNAKNGVVSHYGTAMNVKVEAIKGESYHEYGIVDGTLTLESGHVQVEKNAEVASVVASKSADVSLPTSKLTTTNGSKVGTVVVNDNSVEIKVDNGSNVAEVAPGAGVTIDSSKVTGITPSTAVVDTTNSSNFAGGLGTESSPYLIATVEQFVNIGKLSDEMHAGVSKYFQLMADIDLRTYNDFNQFTSGNVKAISGYFRGCLDGKKDSNSNYKLIANDSLYYIFINSIGNSLFSNIDYYYANELVAFCPGQSGNTTTTFDNVDMYTVDKSTSINIARNEGLYCHWIALDVFNDDWTRNNNVIVKNADVYVNLIGEDYNAVFFGGSPYYGGNGTVMDSTYYGNYYGEWTNLVLGNTAHQNDYSLNVVNVTNKGLMAATKGSPMIAGGAYNANTKEDKYGVYTNVSLGVNRYLYDNSLNINVNENGLKITQASSESTNYYVLSISGGTRLTTPTSENSVYTFRVKISKDSFANNEYQTNFKDGKLVTVAQYKEFVDSNTKFDSSKAYSVYGEENAEFWMVEKDGTLYYVFDFHDNDKKYFITKPNGVITSSLVDVNSATIIAYDSEGLPIAQKEITLK